MEITLFSVEDDTSLDEARERVALLIVRRRIGRLGELEFSQTRNVLIGREYRERTKSRKRLRKMSLLKLYVAAGH